jgi:hypothetical protein
MEKIGPVILEHEAVVPTCEPLLPVRRDLPVTDLFDHMHEVAFHSFKYYCLFQLAAWGRLEIQI